MAFDLGTAIGYLDLDTSKFKKGFKSALGDLETFNSKTSTTGQKTYALGSALSSVGSTMTKNVTVPLVGLGTAAMAVGNKFESAMSRVQAISGATGDELKALTDQALDLGATTSFSASEAAAGMENLASAGFTVEEIMAAMPGMMDLAASSGTDLATASEIAASAIRGFGLEAASAGHVADVFAEAAARTNAQTEDMGEAMKYVAPVASAMGQTLEETAAAIGIMSDAGIKGSQAGTALRGAMSRLAKPTEAMQKKMDQLGLSFFDAQGNMLPLNGIVQELETKMAGLTQEQRNNALVTIFGQEALSGILALMDRGSEELVSLAESFEQADGAAAEMAEVMMNNTSGSIEEMMGSLETLAIKVQQVLAPVITDIVKKITEFIGKLGSMDESTLKMIVTIAAVVAAIGPVLSVVGKLLMTIGSLPGKLAAAKSALAALGGAAGTVSAPVLAIVAAVTALVAAFVTLWNTNEEFRNSIIGIWENIKSTIVGFFDQLTESINSLGFDFENFGEVMAACGEGLKIMWMGLCDILGPYFIAVFNNISIVLRTTLDVIIGIVNFFIAVFTGDWEGAWEAIKDIFMAIWNGIVDWFKNIGNMFIGIADNICGWFGTTWEDTWNSIKDFFVGIWTSIKDFFVGIWEGMVGAVQSAWNWIVNLLSGVGNWIYNNVIAPVIKFFTNLWKGIVNAYHTVIDPWIEIFRRLSEIIYNDVILPIQQFFTDLWNGITSGLQAAWDWIVNLVSTVASWVDNTVIKPVRDFFTNLWGAISGAASACWNAVMSVWKSVSNWFKSTIIEPIKGFFTGMWDGLKNGAQNAWNGIKSVFSAVANFFGNIFRDAWEKVKAVFSTGGKIFDGIKEGIVNAFKAVVNTIIKGINAVVALPFKGLNGILDTLSGVEIVGIKPFSWLTWRAPVPQIPMLAEGAVIDANNPFLAILGDQKSGVNIEAPLSTIQEAVAIVLEGFATTLIEMQNLTVVILGDILQAILSFSELKDKVQTFQEAAGQAALSSQNFDGFTKGNQWFDYEQLAGYLATALRNAPIQPQVSVEMQDGDVYLDKERVGRSIAPVVSRVVVQKS